MNVDFKESFLKDIGAIKDKELLTRVKKLIDLVEKAESLSEITNFKRLKGGDRYYRVRIGDYRAGLIVEGDVVIFVRLLHRREVYRYFP